ncbi:MAG TPA: DUF3293 domain-containing protein [Longimicrobium sp.]|nr:DUF3293 domain-containing protein [Longimicrobium sp.]
MSDPELLALYRSTTWSVDAPGGRLPVRPGGAAPPALRPSAIVTAFNPASRRFSPEANRRADDALRARIAALRLASWPTLAHGTGSDAASAAAWDEPGWCLPGDTREIAVALGRDFGQNAIVWIDAEGAVTMVCSREGFCGARVGQVVG